MSRLTVLQRDGACLREGSPGGPRTASGMGTDGEEPATVASTARIRRTLTGHITGRVLRDTPSRQSLGFQVADQRPGGRTAYETHPPCGKGVLPYLFTRAILPSMSMARIYKKGQITIPKAVREATGFNVGDRVIVEVRNDEIVLRHPIGVLEFTPPQPRPTDLAWTETRRVAREDRVARRSSVDDA